ncbi:HET domain-containing protein [Rutstroemia sp. NJR-2017a BVV2]|nr:HET domain-containing protein [Rutstroemia sp. NJR-2017a BVV2]
MKTDIPASLCEHCKKLDFAKIYEDLQHSDFIPPRKATIFIGAKQYPVLRSAATLKQSAKNCRCCAFLYSELRTAVYISHPIDQRNILPEDLPKGMQNTPLTMRAVPKKFYQKIVSLQGEYSMCPVVFMKSLILSFEDEELEDISADMTLATSREPFRETNKANPLFHSRPVKRNLTTKSVADLVRYWHQRCVANHEFCCDNQGSTVPTRLLDIGTVEQPYIRLIETSGEDRKYIALSYCWGKIKQPRTLCENIEAFKSNIEESMLPATIRDAINVARELQVHYLWVDALCIIQDSKEDWMAESLKMADVYGSAYLTIIASRAQGVHEEFLQPRDDTEVSFGSANEDGSQHTVYLISDQMAEKKRFHEFEITPVGNRAWCFQERRISGRKVHFRDDQMVWECSQGTFYENGLSYNKTPNFFSDISNSRGQNDINEDGWLSTVESYTSCQITELTDRLPAFSGIAKVYAAYLRKADLAYLERGDDSYLIKEKEGKQRWYLAGNWESHMPRSILWRVIDSSPSRQLSKYVAPSWSWASAPGPVKFVTSGVLARGIICKELQYYVDCAGEDTFGQVKGGWISMNVPLLEGRCVPSQSDEGTYDFITPRLRTKVEKNIKMRGIPCGLYLDYQEDVSETLYAAFMYYNNVATGEEPTWSGVLLRKLQAGNAEYERVGCFSSCAVELVETEVDDVDILDFFQRIKIL